MLPRVCSLQERHRAPAKGSLFNNPLSPRWRRSLWTLCNTLGVIESLGGAAVGLGLLLLLKAAVLFPFLPSFEIRLLLLVLSSFLLHKLVFSLHILVFSLHILERNALHFHFPGTE